MTQIFGELTVSGLFDHYVCTSLNDDQIPLQINISNLTRGTNII